MKSFRLKPLTLSLMLALLGTSARADELEELRGLRDATLQLVDVLVKRGLLTREDVAPVVDQAQRARLAASKANAAPGEEPGVVRVPYVPQIVRDQIRDEIKQEVLTQAKGERWGDPGALPDWLDRFTFEGDLRLRYQQDRFPNGNVPNADPSAFQAIGQNVSNTSDSNNRLRLRARFGFQAQIDDKFKAGLRLATGTAGPGGDPVSTNQTLGNYESRYTFGVDRAYLQYQPVPWLALSGGRIANPFFSPTDLVWNENINFDGVAAQASPRLSEGVQGFAAIGAFPLQHIDPTPTNSAHNKWLFGYQGGLGWTLPERSSAKVALSLFDYQHVEAQPNASGVTGAYDASQPQFRQKGNSLFNINEFNASSTAIWGLASKFRELNLSGSLDLGAFDPVRVIVDADYVRNLAYDHNEILQRTGQDVPNKTTGYQTKLTVGRARLTRQGDWQLFAGYRYVEPDAVLDAFTDTDFHLGGTNAKGYFLGGRYGIAKNSYVGVRWLSGKEAVGLPNFLPLSIDVFQLDVFTSF